MKGTLLKRQVSVKNKGYFTWRTKYLYGCALPSNRDNFLKIHTWHSAPLPYKTCKFGHNPSTTSGTLLGEHSTFSALSRLQLEGCYWNITASILWTMCMYSCDRAIIKGMKTPSWLYLTFDSRAFLKLYIQHSATMPYTIDKWCHDR